MFTQSSISLSRSQWWLFEKRNQSYINVKRIHGETEFRGRWRHTSRWCGNTSVWCWNFTRWGENSFFFLHDIIPAIEKLHLVRLKTLPIRRCILSCVGSDIIILWETLVGSRENKSKWWSRRVFQALLKITIIITIYCRSNCRGEQEWG